MDRMRGSEIVLVTRLYTRTQRKFLEIKRNFAEISMTGESVDQILEESCSMKGENCEPGDVFSCDIGEK